MSKHWLVLLLLGVSIGRGAVARADVTATPTQLVLGPTVVAGGQTDTATTTLHADIATTVALQTSGANCNQFSTSPSGTFMIGQGVNLNVTVTFSPSLAGAKTCTFSVVLNGNILASFTVFGNAPILSVELLSAPPLAFGDVEVGAPTPPAQTVTIHNIGSATLDLMSAGFTTNATMS
jgi:hypothetical protein